MALIKLIRKIVARIWAAYVAHVRRYGKLTPNEEYLDRTRHHDLELFQRYGGRYFM